MRTRRFLYIVLVLLLALTVASCGGKKEAPAPAPPAATAAPATATTAPPTATPVPPTDTPVPEQAAAEEATPAEEEAAWEPNAAFETVRAAAETYLTSGKSPVISAQDLYDNLNDGDTSNDPFILSVCRPEDYEIGHLPGAINIVRPITFKPENLAQLPKDKQIVVYCYTGHGAGMVATGLNLLGYDAVNLKYGLMGWTKDDEVLVVPRFDPATQPDFAVETTPHQATETYAPPELSVAATDDDAEIIREAMDNYLSSGKAPTIEAADLYVNLKDGDESNDPFILSVRKPEDYYRGHIPGAINIPWTELYKPENLAKLPADRPIVAYCYTGHTGSVATAILSALGYDVTNLRYGIMGWTKDDAVLGQARFDPATQPDFPVVQ